MSKKPRIEPSFDDLPESAFVRQAQLIPTIIPVTGPTLMKWVQEKTFPAPIKLARCKIWRVSEVREWLRNPSASGLV